MHMSFTVHETSVLWTVFKTLMTCCLCFTGHSLEDTFLVIIYLGRLQNVVRTFKFVIFLRSDE